MSYAGTGTRRLALTVLLVSGGLAGCGGSTTSSDSSATSSGATPVGDGTRVQLVWEPNADPVAGYVVYHGTSTDNATTVASTIAINSAGFNPRSPSVTYTADDLSLVTGATVCFRLRAYNADNALSAWSQAACGTI
jgi:hypothetical protein